MLQAVHLVQRVWRNRSANWRWHIKHIKAKQAAEHVCVVIEHYAIIKILAMSYDVRLKCWAFSLATYYAVPLRYYMID
jgi:hypothetical protein